MWSYEMALKPLTHKKYILSNIFLNEVDSFETNLTSKHCNMCDGKTNIKSSAYHHLLKVWKYK